MVFFSTDRLEVQRVSLALIAASILCEVRNGLVIKGTFQNLPEAEVWIKKDEDLNRAFMLCVEHSIGFAKRETSISEDFDDLAVAA